MTTAERVAEVVARSSFKRVFGVSDAQGAILLRMLDEEGHRLARKLWDRDETLKVLKDRGLIERRALHGEERRLEMAHEANVLVEEARRMLPGDPRGAHDALGTALQLRERITQEGTVLTEAGLELARRMKAAGFSHDRLRYTTD